LTQKYFVAYSGRAGLGLGQRWSFKQIEQQAKYKDLATGPETDLGNLKVASLLNHP